MPLFKDFIFTMLFVFLVIAAWRVSEVASWYAINSIVEREKQEQESIEEFFMDWGDDD